MNKAECQHFLHPLNLWCRFAPLIPTKKKGKSFFQLYETYLWQPFLRKRLSGENSKNKRNNKHNTC